MWGNEIQAFFYYSYDQYYASSEKCDEQKLKFAACSADSDTTHQESSSCIEVTN